MEEEEVTVVAAEEEGVEDAEAEATRKERRRLHIIQRPNGKNYRMRKETKLERSATEKENKEDLKEQFQE